MFRTNWMENWFKKNHHSSDWCRAALCFGRNSRRTHRKIWYERMQTRKNEPWFGTKRRSLWWRTGLWLSFLWTGKICKGAFNNYGDKILTNFDQFWPLTSLRWTIVDILQKLSDVNRIFFGCSGWCFSV